LMPRRGQGAGGCIQASFIEVGEHDSCAGFGERL